MPTPWQAGTPSTIDEDGCASNLTDAINSGRTLCLSQGFDTWDESEDEAPQHAILLASDLVSALSDRDALTPAMGLTIFGAAIQGDLELDYLSIQIPVVFYSCHFEGTITLQEANVSTFVVSHCVIAGGSGEDDLGSLLADRMKSSGNVSLNSSRFHGPVRLLGATIDQQLNVSDSEFRSPDEEDAFDGSSVTCGGGILGRDLTSVGSFDLEGVDVRHFLALTGSTINGCLRLDRARVRQGPLALTRTKVSDLIVAEDATIEGSADLEGVECGSAVILHSFETTGSLKFGPSFHAALVTIREAQVFGNIVFGQGQVGEEDREVAVDIARTSIGGDLKFEGGCHLLGILRMERLKVGSNMTFEECLFEGLASHDIQLSSSILAAVVKVEGMFRMADCKVAGSLFLSQFAIGGQAQIARTAVRSHNAEGNSVVLDRLSAGASLQLSTCVLVGAFRCMSGSLASQLIFDDVQLGANEEGDSIDLHRCKLALGLVIKNNCGLFGAINVSKVTLDGGSNYLSGMRLDAEGRQYPFGIDLKADGLRANGDMTVHLGGVPASTLKIFDPKWPQGLRDLGFSLGGVIFGPTRVDADRHVSRTSKSEVAFELIYPENAPGRTLFDVEGVFLSPRGEDRATLLLAVSEGDHIGNIDLSRSHFTQNLLLGPSGRLRLDGADIRSLQVPHSLSDAPTLESAIDVRVQVVDGLLFDSRVDIDSWISTTGNAPGPWYQFGTVMDRMGRIDDGRWLRYRGACRAVSRGSIWRVRSAMRWVTGHGYFPLRTLPWLAVIVAITWGLVENNRSSFDPVTPAPTPSSAAIVGDVEFVTRFDSLAFAVNNTLPVPSSGYRVPVVATGGMSLALMVLKLLGWVLTALMLAGVTGLLKRSA